MTVLPISNVINVTISPLPSGFTTPNVNSLGLFTIEQPNNSNVYGQYISAGQVALDYGTNSVTAQMASNIFAQSPNLLSGGGVLNIIPLIGSVSATNGHFLTASLATNLAAIILVNNGSLKVTLNGTLYSLSNLNFTNCVTIADVAAVMQAALPDAVVTAQTNTITITSNKVGTNSTVALAAGVGGTDMNGSGYFNGAAGTATAGANATGETIPQAITRTSGAVFYAAAITNLNIDDTALAALATAVEALDLTFLHHVASVNDIAGIASTIQQASQTKMRILGYFTGGQSAANLMKSAYAGRAFSTDFTGSNTASTMNLKALVNVVPDAATNPTLYGQVKTAGVDVYVSYQGVPSVLSTGGNDYFDNVYGDLALKFALETAGFNYLRITNTKVPQTEQGMNGLKAAYITALQQFVVNRCIAPGAWNSSETFGDPQTFLNNILTTGYYVYSLPIVQQNSSDRNARKAPLVQIAVKRAGAIQTSNVIVNINN
jgi:hypothetical protein